MIKRPYWLHRIEDSWKRRPVVWLSGVRRVVDVDLFEAGAE